MMQNKVKTIAITGGLASGKSTVLKRFSTFGYKTFSADEIYSELLLSTKFVSEICKLVGVEPCIIDGSATIDRKAVSDKVFSDKSLLKRFNDFTHNAVYDKIRAIIAETDRKTLVFEIPLLFESAREKEFDMVIVVLRNRDERVKSASLRDGTTIDKAEQKINNQFDYDNSELLEHTIIRNNTDFNGFVAEVDRLIERLSNTYAR